MTVSVVKKPIEIL